MRLDDERPSENVEDRRGGGMGGFGFPRAGGRRVRIPVGRSRGGIGIGGIILILALSYFCAAARRLHAADTGRKRPAGLQ